MKDRHNTFFTSDWHIGHANVLVFDQRPFKDLDHMHSVLVNNYNSCVQPDDVCFFLGDMGMGNSDALESVMSRLVGTKVLILGNHDKGAIAMKKLGFDLVLNTASMIIAGKHVTMSHCPLRGIFREDTSGMGGRKEGENWHGESKHFHFSMPFWAEYHLHGHIHSGPANTKPKTTWNQYDVGVPSNNYRPVSISAIESWVSTNEKDKNEKHTEKVRRNRQT